MAASSNARAKPASLEGIQRELDYYREEYNAIGARLLRLQDEQSRTAREARRSRTLAKLIRDAIWRRTRRRRPARWR